MIKKLDVETIKNTVKVYGDYKLHITIEKLCGKINELVEEHNLSRKKKV